MSPYNAYSSTLSSRYSPSISKYSVTSSSSMKPISSRYKPTVYSHRNTESMFESPSTYTPSIYSSSTYTPSAYKSSIYNTSSYTSAAYTPSSTHIASSAPKFNSVSSYTKAITNSNDWKWRSSSTSIANERPLRSPSSYSTSLTTIPRVPRSSYSTYLSENEEPSSKSSSSYYISPSENDEKCSISTGLYNLGNTCFMNSILQCLFHTKPLTDYCIKGNYRTDLNTRSPSNGNLITAFVELTQNVADTKTKSPIRPYRLRAEVQKCATRFSGDNQQDAQEFLRCLLQGLHDDVNRAQYTPSRRNSTRCDSFRSWSLYKDSDDSLIVDLFGGQLKSTLKCTLCLNESITYDPFWDLSLPMPEDDNIRTSLKECYNIFTSPEILDGANKPMCDSCKKKTRSSKQIEVNIFPKVLVIHLKRFSSTRNGQKLNMMVDCPLKLSDLSSRSSLSNRCSYVLYGVVDHSGSKNSGHYVAKCRSPLTNEWFEFNDTRITKSSNIVTSNSYILFYSQ